MEVHRGAQGHIRNALSRCGGSARTGASGPAISRLSGAAEIRRPGTPSSFGARRREDAVAAARLDFADALEDVCTPGAALLLDRIALARSLHDLWHLRGELFDQVSIRHDQAEAGRRLAELAGHFAERSTLSRLRDAARAASRPADL
ncbi:MAG: hypothetical protein ABIQ33_10390 [Caldimonas sp.]